jgi:DHA2 family multidrug resistance protein
LETLHAGGMGSEQSYELLNRLVDSQAFMLSANDIFYVSAIIFIGLIGLVWLARPPRGGAAGAAAASGAH